MKNVILVLLFLQFISINVHSQKKPAETKKDTIINSITVVNNYPDTLKTFTINAEDSSSFKISDWLTLALIIITIIGLFINARSVNKQLNHMSDQINLMEAESESYSYRYYYDKWLEMEDKITKDVLLKRFPELDDDEKKIDEVINFVKYLDTQLTYIETSKNFSNYYSEDLTIYKILQIEDYREYWEKYVRELFTEGTSFSKSMDNTIKLIKLEKNANTEESKQMVSDFKAKLKEEWEKESNRIVNEHLERKAEMKYHQILERRKVEEKLEELTNNKNKRR